MCNIRHFILNILLISCVISVACKRTDQDGNKNPPNILWLVCEDQWSGFFPMYGDYTVQLPYLEKLAEEGIVFDRAFATVPVCAPSRSAIITGMYPTTLGTHNMRTYNGWNDSNQPEIGIPSYSPVVPENVRCFTEYLRKAGYYCTNNAKEDYNFKTPVSAWDESSRNAHWRNRPGDQSFFSVFNFNITHESRIWMYGDSTLLVDPKNIVVPPFFPDDPVIRHDLAVNYSNLVRLDHQIGNILRQLKDDGLYDETVIFFYSDHGGPFPRFKRALFETGIKIPLMIRSTDPGDHEMRENAMVSFIDFGPTILSLAGIRPPDHMQGRAFLGKYKAEKKPQCVFATADRFDETYDRVRAVRSTRYKYIRNFNPAKPYALPNKYRMNMPMMQRLTALNEQGLLSPLPALWMSDHKPPEELYDLVSDPFELKNLVNDPIYQDTLERMSAQLDRWMMETNDLGRFDEKELIGRWRIDCRQPELEPPIFKIKGDGLKIMSGKSDATIVWRDPASDRWSMYDQPLNLEEGDTVQAKVVRIGFADSKVVVFPQNLNEN